MLQNRFLLYFDVEPTNALNEYAQVMWFDNRKHFHRMDAVVHNRTL